MSANAVSIAAEPPFADGVAELLAASDRYHQALYPAESNHLVGMEELAGPLAVFLVARRDGAAIGCGSVVGRGPGWAELKRMWIDPAARGLGLGRAMLLALETEAKRRGWVVLRLETGISQPEALGLYEAAGYCRRGPFGTYTHDPLSVFMEKALC